MNFEDAECFDDLVDCNISFLQGELEETPSHLAPLNEESSLIVGKLITMGENGVLTICSQPAYVKDERRQRGYVVGAVMCDAGYFVDLLIQTNLDYIIKQGDFFAKRVTRTNADEKRWDFSQVNRDGKWKTCTGIWLDKNLRHDMTCEYGSYSTDKYDVECDDQIAFFYVCDKTYGLETTHCCDELLKVVEKLW